MWKPIRLIAAAAAVAGLAGCPGPDKEELPAPPSIETFVATPAELSPGGSSTLTFTTTNATKAQILDVSGTVIHEDTTPETGEFVVSPSETSVYLLRAEGKGGRATHFVQVAVGEGLENVTLLAVPAEVRAGEEVNLLWTARNATGVTIRDAAGNEIIPAGATNGSGVEVVRPARTTSYTLNARGAADEALTAAVTARVRPTVSQIEVTPQAVKIGEEVTLRFRARGGETLTLQEAVFGHLPGSPMTNPDGESDIEVKWTVPATLPSGQAVINGMPLSFTLEVATTNPDMKVRSQGKAVVGDGPFLELVAPEAVTVDHPITISWTTENASSVRVLKDGHEIGGTLSVEKARVARGSYTYPKVTGQAPVVFTVVAEDEQGVQVPRSVTVTPVPLPVITSFTAKNNVGATLFPKPGDPVTVEWTTTAAARVEVQLLNGVALRTIDRQMIDASQIDDGEHVFPVGNSDTLILRAFNLAGQYAESTTSYEVEAPADIQLAPVPLVRGSFVTLESRLNSILGIAAIHGMPSKESTALPAPEGEALFTDISNAAAYEATELRFEDRSDGVAAFSPGRGFGFPFFDQVSERVFVAVDGAVMLGSGRTVLGGNQLFDAIVETADGEPYPAMIAPYWNDLRLGSESKIHAYLDGNAFPRRLIVQWTDMELAEEADARLTFQVHLYETGAFDFVYGSLTAADGGNLDGRLATIGFRLDGNRSNGSVGEVEDSGNPDDPPPAPTAKVQPGMALRWFRSPFTSGAHTFKAAAPGVMTVFLETLALAPQRPQYIPFTLDLRTLRHGALVVSEVMANPANEAPEGIWVELYNHSLEPVRLGGMALKTDTMATPLLLANDVVPPRSYYVVAHSADPFQNGGLPRVNMPVPAADLPIVAAGDSVKLLLPEQLRTPEGANEPYSALGWQTTQTKGTSLQAADPWTKDTGGSGFRCDSVTPFGDFQIASPGAPNAVCFPEYSLEQIPVEFEEVANLGIPLFSPGEWDDDIATFELLGAPVPLFGRFERTVKVSTNGALAVFDSTFTWANTRYIDIENPTSGTPNGAFAIYGDDVFPSSSIDSNVYATRVEADGITHQTGRWIFQWKKVDVWDKTDLLADSDLNFQIKLFDDGVVEFHYGHMFSPAGQPDYAGGASAIVMVENRTGARGMVLSSPNNGPGTQAHTAFRFVPRIAVD